MNKKPMQKLLIAAVMTGLATTAVSQEETTPQAAPAIPGMTAAMQRSMDPQAYTNMLQLLSSNPAILNNPVPLCAQCHEGEALARYQKTLLPMYQLMMNPANWMNPNAYTQAMAPMMDPETYTEWYKAWMNMMTQMYAPQTGYPSK